MNKKILNLFIIVAMLFSFVSTSVFAYNSNSEKISLEERETQQLK